MQVATEFPWLAYSKVKDCSWCINCVIFFENTAESRHDVDISSHLPKSTLPI